MNKVLSYESNGYCFVFEEKLTSPFFIDFNEFNPNIVSGRIEKQTYPGMDGVSTFEATLGERNINLSAKLIASNLGTKIKSISSVIDEYKNILSIAFHPKNTGVLRYRNNTGEYFIECRPTSIPAFGSIEFDGVLPFSVELYSDSSYWSRKEENKAILGGQDNVIELPTTLPETMPLTTNLITNINNLSGLEAYPKIQLFPCVLAPTIINESTGKKLALNSGISDGFYIEIDTAPEKRTVKLFRLDEEKDCYVEVENVAYWLTADSNVDFEIIQGENIIKIITTSAVSCVAEIIWHERVLAV